MTVVEILRYADYLTTLGILVLIIWGGFRKWWVWGWHYSEMERERNSWRELALRGTDLAEELSKQQPPRFFPNEK